MKPGARTPSLEQQTQLDNRAAAQRFAPVSKVMATLASRRVAYADAIAELDLTCLLNPTVSA
jgi:hypothetical protein